MATQNVVEDAIREEDTRRYGESAPPSDPIKKVLTRLDIAADLQPIDAYSERVNFKDVGATYCSFSRELLYIIDRRPAARI